MQVLHFIFSTYLIYDYKVHLDHSRIIEQNGAPQVPFVGAICWNLILSEDPKSAKCC